MIFGAKLYPVRKGHDVAEAMPALEKAGFVFFEFGLEELSRLPEKDFAVLEKFKGKIGLHFPGESSPIAPIDMADSSPETKERILVWLEKGRRFASELGAKTMIVHAGYKNAPEAEKNLIANLRFLLENSKLTFLLENLPHQQHICTDPQQYVRVIKAVNNPRLKALFDVEHAWQASQFTKIPSETFLTEIFPYLGYVHMCDNDGKRDHVELGNGKIDFRPILRFLKEKGYNDKVVFELFVPDWRAQLRAKSYVEGLLKKV